MKTANERARALAASLARRGVRDLFALHEAALLLLDEEDDALDATHRAFLEELRFRYHHITVSRRPADRRKIGDGLVGVARAFLDGIRPSR